MKKIQKFMNKKGFSLVELIIVIAIMAALIAVLAPQYIKYVNKSRKTADESSIDEVVTSLKIAISDPDLTKPADDIEIEYDKDGGTLSITADDADEDIEDAIQDACGSVPALKYYEGATISYDADTEEVSVEYDS